MFLEPILNWPQMPEGYEFVEVAAVATDSAGMVYVFNRSAHPVMVFRESGEFVSSWGDGEFERPHGLTIGADGTLYCTDDLGHTVHGYTKEGERLWTLGGTASDTGYRDHDYRTIAASAGPFNQPTNVALDAAGNRYVSDGYGNARVHKFSPFGELLLSWGEPGAGPGQLAVPHGIAVDSRGRIVVADRENSRLQFFDETGTFIEEWRDVARPCNVFVDDKGRYFVAELGFQAGLWSWMEPGSPGARVSVFDADGRLIGRFGEGRNPMDPDGFFAPHDICVARDGSVYVGEVARSAGCVKAGYEGCAVLRKFRIVE